MTATTQFSSMGTTLQPEEPRPQNPNFKSLLSLELPEGTCVGLRLGSWSDESHPDALSPQAIQDTRHWIHNALHPKEVEFGLEIPSSCTRQTFYLGRLAMRQALLQYEQHKTIRDCLILRDYHGRPTLPRGYLGSISHKGTTGVALVTKRPQDESQPRMGVGIDIEKTASKRRNIAKRVLTEKELDELGQIEGLSKEEEVMLRFSIKESLYKAMHPLICQYVGFREAEVTPHSNGTASVKFQIKSGAHDKFDAVTAHWQRVNVGDEDFFLSSVSITLKPTMEKDEDECNMDN